METTKIKNKQQLEIGGVIGYLEALTKSLKDGKVVVEHGEEFVALDIPKAGVVEVEAKKKKGKAKFSLSLSWRMTEDPGKPEVAIGSTCPEKKAEEITSQIADKNSDKECQSKKEADKISAKGAKKIQSKTKGTGKTCSKPNSASKTASK